LLEISESFLIGVTIERINISPDNITRAMITRPHAITAAETSTIAVFTCSMETMYLTAPTQVPFSLVMILVRLIALSFDESLPFQYAQPFSFESASLKSGICSLSSGVNPVEVMTTLPEELITITSISSFLSKFST